LDTRTSYCGLFKCDQLIMDYLTYF